MRTPIVKADKQLKEALALCILMGLLLLGLVLIVYFSHFLSGDWDRPVPVDVSRNLMAAMRALVYWMLPPIGVGYLWIGYTIWSYRRKRGVIKESESHDA